jgi:hypothetical protein
VKSTAENPLISYRGSRPMACMSRSLIAKANGNFTMISPNGSCCALPLFPLQVAKMKKSSLNSMHTIIGANKSVFNLLHTESKTHDRATIMHC